VQTTIRFPFPQSSVSRRPFQTLWNRTLPSLFLCF
jgi:hypothetical protein